MRPGSPQVALVRLLRAVAVVLACACAALLAAPAASAHMVPTSSVQLDVGADAVTALVSIPVTDVEAASGLDLGSGSQPEVDEQAAAVRSYLLAHVEPTSDDGRAWSTTVGALTVSETGNPATTGVYAQLQAIVVLTPPAGAGDRSFNLGYDAVVDRVATHVVIVTVRSDWASGHVDDPYEVGVVQRDTVTDTVQPLHVDLGTGSSYRGFLSMVALGMQHIREGTDHQLFLLTLLLPAPLLARRRRWTGVVSRGRAFRRVGTITLAFTLGHSTTLALGALGVPVPQHLVEAAIAASILVAAGHALRPLFPGREALVAAAFGLVHGLAFSTTLRDLDLRGSRLVLSLLGFNLGIEAMQLIVVALVLPPLILLARCGRYRTLRVVASLATGVAAAGWLAARIGAANPVAVAADQLGVVSLPVVLTLWLVAAGLTLARRPQPSAGPPSLSVRPAGWTSLRGLPAAGPDGTPRGQRLLGRVGRRSRGHGVLRGARVRPLAPDELGEGDELGPVGRREALGERPVRWAGREDHSRLSRPQRRRVVEAHQERTLRTLDLEPDVVAGAVVAARRDRGEGAVGQRDQGERAVHVTDRADGRVAPVGAAGVDLDDVGVGEPAEDVEVVHRAVSEEAP